MTIFTVFFVLLFWLQILNLPASLQNKNNGLDRFHGNGPYCKILTEKNHSEHRDLLCHIINRNIMTDLKIHKQVVSSVPKHCKTEDATNTYVACRSQPVYYLHVIKQWKGRVQFSACEGKSNTYTSNTYSSSATKEALFSGGRVG